MTFLAAPPKPHPADPNRPWPGLPPYPGVFAMATDDMPVPPTSPGPPPPPTPRPGISLRIGHAPRLPRRERTVRLLNQLGRYALAWGVVGWACYWIGDAHLFVPGLVIAALVANPWRPKRPSRPVRRATRLAFHSPLLRLATRAGWLLLRAPVRT